MRRRGSKRVFAPMGEWGRAVVDGGVVEAVSEEWVPLPIGAARGGRGGGVGIKGVRVRGAARSVKNDGSSSTPSRSESLARVVESAPLLAPVTADGGSDARHRHHRHGGTAPCPRAPLSTGPATGGTTVATVVASSAAWAPAAVAAALPSGCRAGTAPSEGFCPQVAGRARRPARRRSGLPCTAVPADALRKATAVRDGQAERGGGGDGKCGGGGGQRR